jgi:iron complex outermembrane recepter protein
MKKISTLFLSLFALLAQAQQGSISGTVNDSKNELAAFANVLLLRANDSTLVKGNITDEFGKFSFENIPFNDYFLSISLVGSAKYRSEQFSINNESPNKNWGTITLQAEASTLKEVVITSQKQLFERKPDKTVVNVSADLTADNATAMDILQKSPGITIDKDGNINMKGKTGVIVMIDGKQTYLSSDQLVNLLHSTQASQIEQIELITNPSSKYDAEGTAGIINLKLKKSKLYGTNGSASIAYSQGLYSRENASITLNHRTEKINVFGNYNCNVRNNFNSLLIDRRFKSNGALANTFKQNSWIKEQTLGNGLKTGIDYFINDKNTLGFIINAGYSAENGTGDNTTTILDGSNALSSSVYTYNTTKQLLGNYSGNVNYESKLDTSGTKLNVDVDFGKFTTQNNGHFAYTNYNHLNQITGSETKIRNNALALTTIQSIKADVTKPVFHKQWKLESGVKASSVTTDNEITYYNLFQNNETIDHGKSNRFIYDETIIAGYGIIGKEWKKFTLQIGLRGEQTLAKGNQQINDSTFTREYFQLFPTGSASYLPSEKHQWGLSYSRRIDRPDYEDLNPFKFFLDQYTYQQGNPFLQPQFSHNYEFSYTFMQALSGVLGYSRTNNIMMDITRQNDATHVTYVNKENLDRNDNYSFSLSFPVPIAKWLMSNNSITSFYNHFDSKFSEGRINTGSLSHSFNSSNQITLPKKISIQVDFFYNSAMVYGIFNMKPQYGLNLALQKKILNDRGKIKIAARNILRNEYQIGMIDFQNMDFTFKQKMDNRFISLSFTYNFGKTTVAQARKRTSGADDEKNRVKQ